MLTLWINNVETWNSICAYKREFGIFPYYIVADLTNPENACGETGVIYAGVLKTFIASLLTLLFVTFTWIKITKRQDQV
ncbi:hypothetical protein [Shewanella violacea]|uniref:Uncharacterized protein n=1 Tax=Shewanella violacea (strain JCM 10179 / CIP 106290 / LMG 19151 / DSS12) TaxID=637905 RepID=D4ZB36_SHEVD|nr:hypothetical protein SVI_3260 [Shewanella violacea DSS12]